MTVDCLGAGGMQTKSFSHAGGPLALVDLLRGSEGSSEE